MKKLFTLCFLVFLVSCNETCNDASTGPPIFRLEIVDAVTNENVFTNGTFTESQIQVTSPNSDSLLYSFIAEDNINQLQISPAWEKGIFTTVITVGPDVTITISTKIKQVSDDCHTNFLIEELIVDGHLFYYDSPRDVYVVKI